MTPKETIKAINYIRLHTRCNIAAAHHALYLRDGIAAFAVEYIRRVNLCAIMSDEIRYPRWTAYRRVEE